MKTQSLQINNLLAHPTSFGKTSGDNLQQIIVLRFPESDLLSTAVIPMPWLSQWRYPDNA